MLQKHRLKDSHQINWNFANDGQREEGWERGMEREGREEGKGD